MIDSTGSVLMTAKKSASSRQRADAYSDIKTILINAYPEALSMDDLVKATGHHWKQSEILLAANHGTRMHELLRDATYYPARYRINPDILQPQSNTDRRADQCTTQQRASLEGDASCQPAVTVIHKKKKVFEVPRDTKGKRPGTSSARQRRQSGVFKEIVACLIRSDTHLTADEILYNSGIQSSKAVLMSVLSARLARKQIARDAGSKPYRYFVPDHLKASYIAKFDLNGEQLIQSMHSPEAPARPVHSAAMPTMHQAAMETNDPYLDASFDIMITLRGKLTLTIEDQTVILAPKQARQLARMIRHMAD